MSSRLGGNAAPLGGKPAKLGGSAAKLGDSLAADAPGRLVNSAEVAIAFSETTVAHAGTARDQTLAPGQSLSQGVSVADSFPSGSAGAAPGSGGSGGDGASGPGAGDAGGGPAGGGDGAGGGSAGGNSGDSSDAE